MNAPTDVDQWLYDMEVALAIVDYHQHPARAMAELSADYLAKHPEFADAHFADDDAAIEEASAFRRIVSGLRSAVTRSPLTLGGSPHFVDIEALAAEYRKVGLEVVILPGAHRRAARMYASVGFRYGVWGSDKHHTAQGLSWTDQQSIDYMTFHAPFPVMCNVFPSKDVPGRIYICAAGATYTAGAHPAWGPLPADKGNERLWSWECPNNGVGERWPDHLVNTMLLGSAVEANFFARTEGWETEFADWRMPGHWELTTRKIDPWGPSLITNFLNIKWPMGEFRRRVRDIARLLRTPPPVQPPTPPAYTHLKDRILMTTFGPLTTSPTVLRDTRNDGTTKFDATSGSRKVKILAANTLNPVFDGMTGVQVTIEAVQVEGFGYISANGTTVAHLNGAANGARSLNTVSLPVDSLGNIELTVHQAKCHLIVSRVGHHGPV